MKAGSIVVIQGDITKVPADAIVNAANSGLREGGGVCGAIFRSAGSQALAESCGQHGHCPTGSAVITPAFAITTAKFIIHAVGPVYAEHTEGEAQHLLRSSYTSALTLATDHQCKSIAFPAISTGIYGYPLDKACYVAVSVCADFVAETPMEIKLVAFDDQTATALRQNITRSA